jgi:hypothetical protein
MSDVSNPSPLSASPPSNPDATDEVHERAFDERECLRRRLSHNLVRAFRENKTLTWPGMSGGDVARSGDDDNDMPN